MLIQAREDGLRLIPQHEHGLLAGELAAAWRGPDGAEGVAEEVVLATALHDLSWIELDREPRWDPDGGGVVDFLRFPPEEKYEAAADGIERVSELHPYAGVLVSLHYTTFGAPGRPANFEEVEEERRLELLAELEDEAPGPDRIRRDLGWLRLFDNLSLFLCLTPPGAEPAYRPPWLGPDLLTPPEAGEPGRLSVSWDDDDTARIDPWAFAGRRLEVGVECRDLSTTTWSSRESLAAAWREADAGRWEMTLAG